MRVGCDSTGKEVQGDTLVAAVEDCGFEAKLLDRGEGQETVVLQVRLKTNRKRE